MEKHSIILLLFITIPNVLCASIGRHNVFQNEKILTHQNVNLRSFGIVQTLPVTGQVYAQPIIVPNITDQSNDLKSYLIVATTHNLIYAFDIQDNHREVWKRQVEPSCPLPDESIANGTQCPTPYTDILVELGIISTPVVDTDTMVIYFVTHTCTPIEPGLNTDHKKIIHAIFVVNGTDYAEPQIIDPSNVPGARVPYYANTSNQRCSLILADGYVYVAFASFCDAPPYSGWIMAFDSSNLSLDFAWNSAIDRAGIWQSGAPLTISDDGFLYAVTSNGIYDPQDQDFGNSVVKLLPKFEQGKIVELDVVDWFAPYEFDYDLGSTEVAISGRNSDLLVTGSNGFLFIMNTTNLGKQSPNNTAVHQFFQVIPTPTTPNSTYQPNIHSILVWNGPIGPTIYCMGEGDSLKMFPLSDDGYFSKIPYKQTLYKAPPASTPGGFLSLSSDGTQNAILWITVPLSGDASKESVPGDLIAVNAYDVSNTLWKSSEIYARDETYGFLGKFNPVVIHEGRVYVATFSEKIVVYGVLPPPDYSFSLIISIIGIVLLFLVSAVSYCSSRSEQETIYVHDEETLSLKGLKF